MHFPNRLRDTRTALDPAQKRMDRRVDHPAVRALPRRYPSSMVLRQARRARLLRLQTRHPRRIGTRLGGVLVTVAHHTVTIPAGATHGRRLAGELDCLHACRGRARHRARGGLPAHHLGPVVKALLAVDRTAGTKFLTQIGHGARSASGAQFPAYADFAPAARRSGSAMRSEVQSCPGDRPPQNTMFPVAANSVRAPTSAPYYDRKP